MPTATTVTTRLRHAVTLRDRAAVVSSLTAFCFDPITFDAPLERAAAAEAVVCAMRAWPQDAGVVGGGLCALYHVTERAEKLDVPVADVLTAVKPFASDPLVVAAASRVLSAHTQTASVMVELPRVAEAAAQWLAIHDADVAHWAAHVLIKAAGQEPADVRREHGSMAAWAIDASVVKGAVLAEQAMPQVRIRDDSWSSYVLEHLYPRLRRRQ